VVWRWNTFDYLSQDHYCPACIEKKGDWTHSNSLSFQIEGNRRVLYLSVRNLNQIIKLNVETEETIWILGEDGDFRMFEMNGTEVAKLFSHQHDPEILPNGNILLFDNGLHRGGGKRYSRVIEITFVYPSAVHVEHQVKNLLTYLEKVNILDPSEWLMTHDMGTDISESVCRNY
jgi:hypothetical protein